MDFAKVTLKVKKVLGKRRPLLHVLMPDGRVTEFKNRGIVIPEASDNEADQRVYALLINADGDAFVTPDNSLAVVAVPVVGLDVAPDPDKMLSWKEAAKRIGVSLSTAKRMTIDGRIPKPQKLGKRKIGFRQGDIVTAIEKLK